jgi:hypothetical protein
MERTTIQTNNRLSTVVEAKCKENALDMQHDYQICALFERTKQIYKCAENDNCAGIESEAELLYILSEFQNLGHKKGVIFTQKALSVIHEKFGDKATEIEGKIMHYESAHESINNATIQATQINWVQPSLLKRQAIIKNKLGNCLHQKGDHHNANILEADSSKIFGKVLIEYQDYAEGYVESVSASLSKIKWVLSKKLFDLNKAENYFSNPSYRNHLSDQSSLQAYRQRINELRNTINLLLAVAQ